MALVAGVDSSTQSCTVVIRDADTGDAGAQRAGAAPARHGGRPGRAGGTRCRRRWTQAGGLDDVDAIAVAGQQHGMVCLDADGAVVRPALLWNDTRSAGAADDLVAELGAKEWADADRQRAGRVDHRDQAALAGPPRAGARRGDRRRVPAARLADLEAARHRRPRRPGHRPQRRLRHRLLVRGHRRVPPRPARTRLRPRATCVLPRVLGPAEAAGRTPDGALLGPGAGDNAGAALGLGAGPGDVVVSLGTSGVVSAVSRRRDRRPDRHHRRVRLGHRRAPAAGVHAERGPGARRGGAHARRRPRRAVPARAGRPARRRRPGAGALPGGRAHPEPARRHRRAARAHAGHARPRRTWPGPPSRGCCAGWPTRWTRWSRPGCRCSGRSWSAGRPGRRRSPGSRRPCSAARCCCPRPASTWPTGPPGRRPGCWPGRDAAAGVGGGRHGRAFEADPTPAVRERYAEVRDLTAHRLRDRHPAADLDAPVRPARAGRAPPRPARPCVTPPRPRPAGPGSRRCAGTTSRWSCARSPTASRCPGPGSRRAPGSPAAPVSSLVERAARGRAAHRAGGRPRRHRPAGEPAAAQPVRARPGSGWRSASTTSRRASSTSPARCGPRRARASAHRDRPRTVGLAAAAELAGAVIADAGLPICGAGVALPGRARRRTAAAARPEPAARGPTDAGGAAVPAASAGCPCAPANEADLAALAELWFGAGSRGAGLSCTCPAAIGVGAGIVLGGELFRGAGGRAGELGHVVVEPDGPRVQLRRAAAAWSRPPGRRRCCARPARRSSRSCSPGRRPARRAARPARSASRWPARCTCWTCAPSCSAGSTPGSASALRGRGGRRAGGRGRAGGRAAGTAGTGGALRAAAAGVVRERLRQRLIASERSGDLGQHPDPVGGDRRAVRDRR